MSTDSGGIAPGGRFDRIEASLNRIETKLDDKVGHEEFGPLLRRVELLESGETPLSKVLLGQFNQMQSQLAELMLHGSQNAQFAGKRVGDLETQVTELKTARVTEKELAEERREREAKFHRLRTFLVSAASATAAVVSVLALIIVSSHS